MAESETPARGGAKERVRALLRQAVGMPQDERIAFLESSSESDVLRKEVERLLLLYELDGPEDPPEDIVEQSDDSIKSFPIFRTEQLVANRFRIVEWLGRGGFGEVYRAEDTLSGETVALKTLRAERAGDARTLLRFRRELLLARQVTHPNVCRVFDVFTHHDDDDESSTILFTMELLQGVPLSDHLRQAGPLSTEAALGLIRQICAGLGAVHQAGLVHRDFKSGNVILVADRDGSTRAVVTDFGLATPAVPDEPGITGSVGVIGTPAYMAPEQLEGGEVTPATDIYALGIVCFEMLTGHQPFEDETPMRAAIKRLYQEPPSPRAWTPQLPAFWNETVLKCLKRDPSQRFQNVADVLKSFSRGSTVMVENTAVARSSRVRVLGLSAALGTIVLLLVFFIWPPPSPEQQAVPTPRASPPSILVTPFQNLSGDTENDYLVAGIEDVLTTNLASVPGLLVVPPSPDTMARLDPEDLSALADALGVTHLVSATIQRSGPSLRVSLRLLEADTPRVSWSGVYDGTVSRLFDLQRDMFEGVLAELDRRDWLPEDGPSKLAALVEDPPQDPFIIQDLYRANLLIDRADSIAAIDRAIEILASVTAREPEFALAHARLAEAYWIRYRRTNESALIEKAKGAALEALRLQPELPTVRYALAVIFHGTGRSEDAIQELRRALSAQPAHDYARRFLANIYSEQGLLEEAVAEMRTAMNLRPRFAGNYGELGLIYFAAGRYADAAAAFEDEVTLEPRNAAALQRLGTAYHASGDLKRAAQNYERAIEIAPTSTAHSNLGTIRYIEGRLEDAVREYERALELRPKIASSHLNLGDAHQRLGNAIDARQSYLKAMTLVSETLEVNPKDVESLALRALCFAKLGDFQAAREMVAAALELAPHDGDTLYNLAAIEALDGNKEESLAALEASLANGYPSVMARHDYDLTLLHGEPRFEAALESQRH